MNRLRKILDGAAGLTRSEQQLLAGLVRGLPDKPAVVNIGAGLSSLLIASAREDVSVVSIDIDPQALVVERHSFKKAGLWPTPRLFQLCGDSKELGQGADLVFIDGDHSRGGCRGDILAFPARYVLALHDYGRDEWPGVKEAADEMLGDPDEWVDTLAVWRRA